MAFCRPTTLASLQERGLADNTVHGAFQTIKAFANWAARDEYPVDAALPRQRGPKVAQKEREVYSAAQVNAIFTWLELDVHGDRLTATRVATRMYCCPTPTPDFAAAEREKYGPDYARPGPYRNASGNQAS